MAASEYLAGRRNYLKEATVIVTAAILDGHGEAVLERLAPFRDMEPAEGSGMDSRDSREAAREDARQAYEDMSAELSNAWQDAPPGA